MKFVFIAVALLSGVAVFIAILMIVKGGALAVKRKKTKLGLVRIVGAGLKFDDESEESEDSKDSGVATAAGGGDAVINTGGSETTAEPAVDTGGIGEGPTDGIADVVASGVDVGEAVADTVPDSQVAAAVSDGLDVYGEDAECVETLAIPLGSIDVESDKADPIFDKPSVDKSSIGEQPVEKPFIGGKLPTLTETPPIVKKTVDPPVDKPLVEKPFIGSKSPTFTAVRPVVKKIIETPVENPFINKKAPASGDGAAKKMPTIQRRRLPETVKMKDRKVILAEDVAINRDLIAMYFDGSGVKFDFAVNGREVCEKFERDPNAYSLILMDIQMPEMDGYEVSRRIRSMDADWAKQIPIIAMTGNDQKEDIDLCFEAGMDDHIPKPIDMEVLQEKVFDIITLNAE